MLALTTVLIGPMLFRTDLRSDLRRLDVLRTLPLSGLQVVRGELMAPALLLSLSEVALLLLAVGLSAGTPIRGFPLAARLAWAAGAAVLLPAATAAVLVVQNAAALVFPSLLVDDEESAPRGVEAAGTRLLNLGATLLLLLLGFLPGGLLGVSRRGGGAALGLGASLLHAGLRRGGRGAGRRGGAGAALHGPRTRAPGPDDGLKPAGGPPGDRF